MKKIILLLIIATGIAYSQLMFTRNADTLNPINNFTSNAVYRGASWVDIDNDNDLDLFASPKFLFMNEGNNTFTEIVSEIGSGHTQGANGSTWADYDNDGDIDCFLASNPSRLYRNNGSGLFSEDAAVFEDIQNYPGWGNAFGDFNNDGRLDLVIAHPAGFLGPSFPSFFFIADENGKLRRDTTYNFTTVLAPYTVPYWSDFDLDNDLDLFIASGPGGSPGLDYLYRNLKTETGIDSFSQIIDLPFATDLQDGQCYNFIDYDNDEDLDLLITNWGGMKNRFYKNENGTYTEINVPFNYNAQSLGNTWGDLDNDGDLDVLIANDRNRSAEVYLNNGDGTFLLEQTSISALLGSNSIVLGDYDNDGDLDVYVMGNASGRGLFENDTPGSNSWISFKLEGVNTNRSAIGAKVKLKAVINGNPVWQFREVSAQNTFQGQNDLRVHFGLGDAVKADSIMIIYLGGETTIAADISANRFYEHKEGEAIVVTGIKEDDVRPVEFNLYQNYPNPFNPVTTIKYSLGSDQFVSLKIYDLLGREVSILVNQDQKAGEYEIEFDALKLSSGIYFYNLKAGNYISIKKMTLLK